MDLYIDKENLLSFIQSKDKEGFDDCKRMLKRQLHIIYNININIKKKKEQLEKDPELLQKDPELLPLLPLLPWINGLGEGRGNSEETDTFREQKFPVRPIKSNTCNTWDRKELTSVYLISDEDCRKLKDCGSVLIGDEGEEVETLSRLFCGRDYDYHHLYDLQKNFHSWDQLVKDNLMLPTTDIIINDRYLFKNQDELVEHNLRGMLNALAKNVNKRINIVIYLNSAALFSCEKILRVRVAFLAQSVSKCLLHSV